MRDVVILFVALSNNFQGRNINELSRFRRLTFEGLSPSRRSSCFEHADLRDFDVVESKACVWQPNCLRYHRLRPPDRGPSSLSYNAKHDVESICVTRSSL